MDLSMKRSRSQTAINRATRTATDAYAEGRRRASDTVDAIAGRRRSRTAPVLAAAATGLAVGAAAVVLVARFGRRVVSRATAVVTERRTDDLDQLIETNRTQPNTTPRSDVLSTMK